MITQFFSLVSVLYDAIGPGLILVAALPAFVLAGVVLLRSSLSRSSGGS